MANDLLKGTVTRLHPAPEHVMRLDGRDWAVRVQLSFLQCVAQTKLGRRCGNDVQRYGQVARWDDEDRYDVDRDADSPFWLEKYGTAEHLRATFRRQRCLVHVDGYGPDAVPLDIWPLG